MKKTTHSKLHRIKYLLTGAYVLLVIFSIQWLVAQFEKEEHRLQQAITQVFDEEQQHISDSILLFAIQNPNWQLNAGNTLALNKANTITLDDDTLQRWNAFLQQESSTPLSLQGMKLMIRKVDQFNEAEQRVLFSMDTSVFNTAFAERLRHKGWQFDVLWVSHRDKDKAISNRNFFIPNHHFLSDNGVLISGYNNYLLQQLLVPLAFVLVVLLSIFFAFYTLYKNIVQQYRLHEIKDDFVSNISHELKTPIATVKVALEAIQHFEAAGQKEMTADYMYMATHEMDRLELLVNKSLHTTLLASGKLSMQMEKVNMKTLVAEVVQAYQVKCLSYDAQINCKTTGEDFNTIADPLHVQGVLINLLDNALKYSGMGAYITIDLIQSGGYIKLLVSDNGPGIDTHYHTKVFEKYFRVPQHNKHDVKGYGLGLNYAAQVMQQHEKGSISIQNNPEQGCTFTVALAVMS
jgi:signal transduction histidine kinase